MAQEQPWQVASLSDKAQEQLQVASLSDDDRPADDEFEIGVSAGISDSDVIDEQEAAEILKGVDARQTEMRKPRFKTEVSEKEALPKDKV